MLYNVSVKFFNFNRKDTNYFVNDKSFIGLENAIYFAEKLAESENAVTVYITDSLTGEILWDWDRFEET